MTVAATVALRAVSLLAITANVYGAAVRTKAPVFKTQSICCSNIVGFLVRACGQRDSLLRELPQKLGLLLCGKDQKAFNQLVGIAHFGYL